MAKVVVLGAGMMGTALTWPLVDNGHEVTLVGTHLDRDIIAALREGLPHPGLGVTPPGVEACFFEQLPKAISDVELVCIGVSSAGVQWAGEALANQRDRFDDRCPIVMISKGLQLNADKLEMLPDTFARKLGEPAGTPRVMAIAGPCIAGELARRVGTCVLITGTGQDWLERTGALFATSYYHLRPHTDVTGVETCAALKNAYAMGMAFAAGLHEQTGGRAGSIAMHNVEAATFAQAIVEMQRFVSALGGEPATVAGLAGVGDLNVTCNGGRTGRFGKLLGQGLSAAEAQQAMPGTTLECLEILDTVERALPFLSEHGLESERVPLLMHMLDVVSRGAPADPPLEKYARA